MFGKLTLSAIPFNIPIVMGAVAFMVLCVIAVLGTITYLGKWKYLWSEWLTSVDHKKIGIMYMILAFIMLLRGFADAIMMRSQQALSYGSNMGYLPPEHFDQVFSAHGTIMIFFMAMPFIIGLMNCILPLQIGARDVAFPLLNNFSLWLTAAGAVLVNISLAIGNFSRAGWLAYPPLSELHFSPGVGVDYYIWALQISGIGTTLTGVNFIATILKMRAPGMKMTRMPVFVWASLCASVLIVVAFPILTVTLGLLTMDRYLGMHFFTNSLGGDPMMYINLIWIWGHPEVYILILPLFGVFSEIVPTFSSKPLFGYASMVYATMAIAVLSMLVWLHHFFTMGAGPAVNAFYGITTMIIAVPTGVKIFNWIFTMYRGRVRFDTPMLWTLGFLITFTIGGMSGVLLAEPPADFVLHNSLFLIAHFHNVIIGGVVFGIFAGVSYWFPKITGFRLHEGLGKLAFWFWFVGFYVAFMPLYALGLMGATRRMDHYNVAAWHPLFIIAAVGAGIIALGIGTQVLQLVVTFKQREKLRDTTGDPWNGRTLEWSLPSPAPAYNFARIPIVRERDAYWDMKKRGVDLKGSTFVPIHMPRNKATGFIMAGCMFVTGFALVWQIWWLVIAGFAATVATLIRHAFDDDRDYHIGADEVRKSEALYDRVKAGSV
ncbi:MAG: cytochrome o ubiquinol oxidase subunit I [Pseudomonadota bacterium]|jgi:cytochrome o ubiquinol oxidase subunit 1|nr:cytochrome o ubiquinol oxidase subunit I [Pseudomonadota bacterium]